MSTNLVLSGERLDAAAASLARAAAGLGDAHASALDAEVAQLRFDSVTGIADVARGFLTALDAGARSLGVIAQQGAHTVSVTRAEAMALDRALGQSVEAV